MTVRGSRLLPDFFLPSKLFDQGGEICKADGYSFLIHELYRHAEYSILCDPEWYPYTRRCEL